MKFSVRIRAYEGKKKVMRFCFGHNWKVSTDNHTYSIGRAQIKIEVG